MTTLGNAAALRAALRRRLGYVTDTVLLTDDVLDDALGDALRTINKHWPIYVVGSFATVADQQSYSPMPAGGREIVAAYWNSCACSLADAWPAAEFEVLDSYFETDEQGRTWSPLPAALAILQRRRSTLDRYFGRSAIVTDRNTVYLDPTPSSSGTSVYYVYSTDRFATVADITDDIADLVDAFWAAACMAGSEALAAGRGAIVEVADPDGTKVRVNGGAHADAAERYRQRLYDALPFGTNAWWMGDAGTC